MTASYKTFAHDRRRGWIAEIVIEAEDPAALWGLVPAALEDLEAHGYTPLDPYAAPIAARVAANLAGQARSATERSTAAAEDAGGLFCPVHNVRMDLHESGGRSWYSHRLPGGEWCNGRPERSAQSNGKAQAELF